MPSRAATFTKAFKTIIRQVDKLYLYLDGHSDVPELVRGDPRVVPILSRDMPGLHSNGKLLGLALEPQPCLYACVDDDFYYDHDYATNLRAALMSYQNRAVVGLHGSILARPLERYSKDRTKFLGWKELYAPRHVDVLGNFAVMFDSSILSFDVREWSFVNMDDLGLAIEAARASVPLVCIARREGQVIALASQQADSIYLASLQDDTRETALARTLLTMRDDTGMAKNKVAIGVCTAQRPTMLASCLDSIAKQDLPEGNEVHLIVADNEAEPNNERAVAQFTSVCPFPIHYVHQPRRGIAIARNAVLNKAEELGVGWLAFTDDDCTVAPDWLHWLLKAAEWYEADIIHGRRVFVSPDGKEWLMPQRIRHEGQPLRITATHNTLFNARLFSKDIKLRFDERLKAGSDTDFALQALKADAKIVYSAKPMVYEHVPPERATFNRQMRLEWRYSAGDANRARRYGHDSWPKATGRAIVSIVWKIPIGVLKLLFAILAWPLNRRRYKQRILKYGRSIMKDSGYIAGLFGLLSNPYRKIDGC